MGNVCKICGKEVLPRDLAETEEDLENPKKVVFDKSFGFACLKHRGVREHFEDLKREKDG